MKWSFAFVLFVHGLLHVTGFAKPFGLVGLLAAVLLFAMAAAMFVAPRCWWVVSALALVVSQAAIVAAWSDAKYRTIAIAIAIVLVGVVFGFPSQGPASFRAEYDCAVDLAVERAVERGGRRAGGMAVVTDADLAPLPGALQKYLRVTGAVGQPRIRSLRARFRCRIRSGPISRWMTFTAKQRNVHEDPARLFFMEATMLGVPLQALHLYVGPRVTMRVKVASIVQVVDATGPDLDRAETVTLFNDMCLLAPGALIDRAIRWEEVDPRTVRGVFTNAGHMIGAELALDDDAGELSDFRSDDRLRSSPDGASFTKTPWSTPVSDDRAFGPLRVLARGDARRHAADGASAFG